MNRFHKAAQDGYLDFLHNATRKDLATLDEDGRTPIHWAAERGNLDALRTIVMRGGNVDDMDYTGRTPLHLATERGHMNCVTFLLSFGCNMWLMDNDQHTALDTAALHGRDEVMKYLDAEHSRKASKNPKDFQNKKEKAVKRFEENIKRFERLQGKAIRKAEKEQKRLEREQSREDDFKAPSNLIERLTIRLKGGTKSKASAFNESRTFSDIVDPSKKGTLSNKQFSQINSSNGVTNSQSSLDKHVTSNGEATRMAVYDVFDDRKNSNTYVVGDVNNITRLPSFNSDDEMDEHESKAPGMFNIPQIGQRAFIKSIPLEMMDSFKPDKSASGDKEVDGSGELIDTDMFTNDKHSTDSGSIGTSTSLENRMDLPWNPDSGDLLALEDPENDSKYASLELFLELCNLTNYLHLFTQENIDLKALMLLSDSHLKEIGLGLGPRVILTKAIEKRKEVLTESHALQDSAL